jgi:hypothetical protein
MALKIGRRKLLSAFATAPLAARAAVEDAAEKLARIDTSGIGSYTPHAAHEDEKRAQIARALLNPLMRRSVEEILYRDECRYVESIDADLVAMRSWSLAAKITFQRRRNVERRLRVMQHGWTWDRLGKLLGVWEE